VAIEVNQMMERAFGERMPSPAAVERLRRDGRRGRKNGRGFYRNDGRKGVDQSIYAALEVRPSKNRVGPDIALRTALRLINEAAFCFGEGVLKSARDGDVGAIFGLGFPPFRGGPFRFVDAMGAREVVARLERLELIHGARFAPAPILLDAARRGASFYGDTPLLPGARPDRQPACFAAHGSSHTGSVVYST
jgi:3-hydroxyacyl-CoA dehydrogenase / enoyl-CoA hydratase / 3-hydroxybutyryl-CoA epimerase